MESIASNLENELLKTKLNIETLLNEYSKLEEINRELTIKKAEIIGESACLKAKTNFLKKEIEIKRLHVDDKIKKHNKNFTETREKKINTSRNLIRSINELVTDINNQRELGLETISEELL